MTNRLKQEITLLLAALLCLVLPHAIHAGETADGVARFDELIESLNAVSERQTRALERIHAELRGTDGRRMRDALVEALFRPNVLIAQGAAEALAMYGDAGDAASLETLLAVSDRLTVKVRVIRLLPVFCLTGAERARFNYIRYAAGYERSAAKSVLEPLRRPPITRRGRLDAELERLRARIILVLAGQFDPVAAALRYVEDRLYGAAARNAVIHFVGNALGNDPSRWARIWAAQGAGITIREPAEAEEIDLAILASLSDMGAEGIPEVRDAFKRLLSLENPTIVQAVFDAMTNMCAVAFADFPALAALRPEADGAAETETWRRRFFASSSALAILAADRAGERLLRGVGDSVFVAAAVCMGEALSFPDDFPDTDGSLAAARVAGVERLARILLTPDLPLEKRAVVAAALGRVGTSRAVSALADLLESPYISPSAGREGMLLAEKIVDSLRAAAEAGRGGGNEARTRLLELLEDKRVYPPSRQGSPPIGLAHLALWRLQRLAKSNETSLNPEFWRARLGW